MQRTIMSQLLRWKSSMNRKPLVLQGARQVGKTWVLKEFGAQEFGALAYVNFLDDQSLVGLFDGDLNPRRLSDAIQLQTDVRLGKDVLLVLDEIQECPRALASLKMFNEQLPEQPVVAAGSLLGVALHAGISFPVGKVDHLHMYPMSFYEYLQATEEALCAPLRRLDFALMAGFSERYTEALKRYLFVGGMPEAVRVFAETGDYGEARSVHERLLFDYEHDFSKYAGPAMAERIRMLWGSVPAQLGRENKKFIYSAVRPGARARGYEEAIQWLVDAGLLLRVRRISKPGIPLSAYEDRNAFKLYLLDVGLLGAVSRTTPRTLLEGDVLFTEFKGALAENYVCQQLTAARAEAPSYWSSSASDGEVDFVYDADGAVIPVEVKAQVNLRAKSLKSFVGRYGIGKGYRLSLADFKEQDWVTNIPLYAVNALAGCGGLAGCTDLMA